MVDAGYNVQVDDLKPGDVWLVPAGVPHSIQGLTGGCEFLLVFDDGNFSENETLLITEFMARTPRSVLAKNFGIAAEYFADIPKSEKYIFRMPVPEALDAVRKELPDSPPRPTLGAPPSMRRSSMTAAPSRSLTCATSRRRRCWPW